MKNVDVLVIGNALVDVFLGVQENNPYTRLNRVDHILCFNYGEKIHVEHCEFLPGGNACNVAVGLGRQAWKSMLCAEIGSDEFSLKIIHSLAKEPIDVSLVKQTVNAQSSFAVGINYGGERTLFVDHVKRKHEFHLNDIDTAWIYLTSLGIEWKQAYQRVLTYVESNNAKLAFSPGTHQFEEEGLKGIRDALALTHILFVNKQEAERITQTKAESLDIQQLLLSLQRLGAQTVVITDGAFGSYSIDEKGKMLFLEAFPAHIKEKTGAGDAYASGFLSAIMSGLAVGEAMGFGAVNASSVIEKIGAQIGLLSKEEIQKKLAAKNKFKTEEIL